MPVGYSTEMSLLLEINRHPMTEKDITKTFGADGLAALQTLKDRGYITHDSNNGSNTIGLTNEASDIASYLFMESIF